MEVEIQLHISGQEIKTLKVADTTKVSELLSQNGIDEKEFGTPQIFVGDCSYIPDPEKDDESDKVIKVTDFSCTIGELNLEKLVHIHICKFEKIRVNINMLHKSEKADVFPSTTIEILTNWARGKFKLDSSEAPNYELKTSVTDGKKVRSDETHIGDLINLSECEVTLDLVKDYLPNAN